jgi:hypothetical protein
VRRWNYVLGAALVVLGGLILLQIFLRALGIQFRVVWLFWPLVFIGLGVWIIRGSTSRGAGEELPVDEASIPLDGATEAFVRVQHGAGRLIVGPGAPSDQLLRGRFGGGLESRSERDDGRLTLEMRIRERNVSKYFSAWAGGRRDMLEWDLRLNSGVPLVLLFETGANESRLDLRDLMVRETTLKTGASSSTIELPARMPYSRLRINSGAAAVRIHVPAGVAATIRLRAGLSSVDVDTARFPRFGDHYRSTDWDSAASKAEITVESGVGSIEVG